MLQYGALWPSPTPHQTSLRSTGNGARLHPTNSMAFTHLHVHSHYSLLDGLSKVPDLVQNAKIKGFTSLALTDHGAMYGTVEFYKTCLTEGLKPILGVETYVAPRRLTDKQAKLDDHPAHLVLLARNLEGYHNLIQLVTLAHLQGFYYKPRVDHEALERYHGGLVALSACLKGEIPQAIRSGDEARTRELLEWYRRTFGEGNFYLEIQPHPELPEQVQLNREIARLAASNSLPIVATNDSHYLEPEDGEAQDVLVCIQTGKQVTDERRLDMRKVDTSLKPEEVMRSELGDLASACDAAAKLADELTVEIPLGQRFFPAYPTPEGETPEAYLRLQAEHGLVEHYVGEVTEEVRQRLEYELDTIMKKGYASYFLVVADFVNWARSQGIIVTTRGSAAGSLVSYLIGITSVNPLTFNLPFERFLNPFRPSPPDIDMDFADNRRDDVIAYVTAKYGVDQVGQIVTFGTMAARGAVRDVGRALGLPYGLCDRVAKLIPFGSQGFHMTLARALEDSAELKALSDGDPQVANLLRLARKVEGCARHASIHAAGVVIAPAALTAYVPLQYDAEGSHIITQYDMWSCEDVGLVKMDFLGIRNLSIMGSAVQIIQKTKSIEINLDHLPLSDAKTFALMAKGETMGMFQLGGSGMTRYLKELRPTTITDVMAMVALFRPGPMDSIPEFIRRKHKPKSITYLDPRLREILSDSYGIITYQDDVLLIAIKLAGYTWEEADKLRKAMGKKIVKEMARQKEKFISGCIAGGMTEERSRELWQLIEPFAAYGFNKAHAASYGIVAYQTAYLKANYPTEFMAALMTAESGDLETIAQAVAECRRMGIAVLPPDVNESLATFTVVDDSRIRFGLTAIKNLGEHVVESIITERKTRGAYRSLADFVGRTAGREFTKKSFESLAKCGALDSFGTERGTLLAGAETLLAYARGIGHARAAQESSLFGHSSSNPPQVNLAAVAPASRQDRLAWERELLGLYVTEHPFTAYATTLGSQATAISALGEVTGEPQVTVAGLVSQAKQVTTKRGEAMLFGTLEDTTGSTEIILFPEAFRTFGSQLTPDRIVAVRGKLSRREGERKVVADSLVQLTDPATALAAMANLGKPLSQVAQGPAAPVAQTSTQPALELVLQAATPGTLSSLKQLCESHPGVTPVVLVIPQPGGNRRVATPYRVSADAAFRSAAASLLGS